VLYPNWEETASIFYPQPQIALKSYRMQKIILAMIRAYQLVLSPFLGQHCRFTPSCSQYAQEAIRKYGAARGSWLGFKRIIRCQPFCEGGHDPVP
jgi:putative membrane protein insertion efficiency factor